MVRFRDFFSDCLRIAGDNSVLDDLIDQETGYALDFLARNYRDIMDNFNPSAVKPRKKRQIILANDKLSELL